MRPKGKAVKTVTESPLRGRGPVLGLVYHQSGPQEFRGKDVPGDKEVNGSQARAMT